MSKVGGISSVSMDYGKFASGKRVQNAADGAAELAIIQKMEKQTTTYDVGAGNVKQATGLANIADGALGGIQDYLGRIHELSIRSMNGFMSDLDKSAIQAEIDQMKQGIEQLAGTAKYNETYLLDGSSSGINVAAGSSNMEINGANSTLKALGIEDFSIMGDFDLKQIEDAISKVSSMRSKIGAQTNAMESAYNYLTNASINTAGSQSRLEDLDIPQAISDMKKQQTLQEYAMNMQKKQLETEANLMKEFFM